MRLLSLLLLAACDNSGSGDSSDPASEADCEDNVDDDRDGRTDCSDFDCLSAVACGGDGGGVDTENGDETDPPPGDDTDSSDDTDGGGDDTDPLPAGAQRDVITVAGNATTDVLFIIDSSASMFEEQAQLASQISSFFSILAGSGVSWHVGVVTADTTDAAQNGKLQGAGGYTYLDATAPGPLALLQTMVAVGTDGSSVVQGRRAADRALNQPTAAHQRVNAGFLQGGSLHLVVLSDSPDASESDPSVANFVSMLNAFTTAPVSFNSIVGPTGGCATAEPGTDYLNITTGVGGVSASICSLSWATTLEAIAHAATGLPERFPISGAPDPSTLRAEIVDGGTTYDGEDLSRGDTCTTPVCFTYVYESAPPIYGIRVTSTRPRHGSEVRITWEPAAP